MSSEATSSDRPEGPRTVFRRRAIPPQTWGPVVVVILLGLLATAVYGYRQHRAVKQLGAEKGQMMAALDATQGQLADLTNRLNELTARQASNPISAPRSANNESAPHRAVHRREDPRWKEVRSQLADQQKQIDANRQDLSSSRTELQGSIARTHDELVALQKRGERNYYEFDLDKNNQFQREGPVGLRLRKANTKHQNVDLELMVDDIKLSKKQVNLNEPVFFYPSGSKQSAELVINTISKNHIHGYVGEPKYKAAELEAMANSSASNPATPVANSTETQPQPQPRQKLETPKN